MALFQMSHRTMSSGFARNVSDNVRTSWATSLDLSTVTPYIVTGRDSLQNTTRMGMVVVVFVGSDNVKVMNGSNVIQIFPQ